ncbi:hypothetical protein CN138_32045 [Sinorhizobium meliloti]|uniref:Transmembrane protein n=1 Tax=Sinorhizobium medicae TaxID=110321 RepID=A0A6G1WQE6_9HYPH|nr:MULTISPECIES: hypothetical protein [Sinorhizobium]AEG52012.1 hypothetical protein Sinme_0241 [Sinorhizobium meliloti AK83]PST29649.1 hypothetical protein C7U62_03435 [Mesorhizobium loti]ARS69763.1 hypothetical protein SMRU11_21945 [Sinorhizobium meliloti RU11/001]ASP64616.1 hypothetical protein CDO29_08460 [Sinorhizobium meliloti]MBP2464645.1 hypothetical protein [Sinorhizobium meliloti]
MDNHFTPFGGRVDPPKQITLREPPLWTYRIVAILFALCCASGGWLANDTVDALVSLDRDYASMDRR